MKYLQSKIHYYDLYDKFTVEECRLFEKSLLTAGKTKNQKKKVGHAAARGLVHDLGLYFIKGERYLKKEKNIEEWLARDKALDEKLENAVEPEGIHCLACGLEMNCESRDLLKHEDPVLFMFRCINGCKRARAFYETGEELFPKKHHCPNCASVLNKEDARKGEIITTHYTCPKCDYQKTDKLDMRVKKEKPDPNFEKDRQRFCLTKEEGEEYRDVKYKLEQFSELVKEINEKEKNKELYDKVAKIKKLKVADIQKLIQKAIEKEGYTNLEFEKPEMNKFVSVSFTVMDNKPDREEYDSKVQLKKLIEKALAKTNWQLMSEGISYRVGYLSGRLRVYETEEDLIKLIQ